MKYRIEIDGLRAIAVSAVLLFHFFPEALPLGYLGVDLFFVISGFLISSHIASEIEGGHFQFSTFYWRRVRRILPATFAVLLATTLVALVLLSPPDLVRFAKSVLATLSFTANIYFWQSGGYFGTSDELKPLLHMWSLGVEEQFYLFFPLILVLIFRYLPKQSQRISALALITLSSLALNMILIRMNALNPAFFLLPTRVWHFGFGILAALSFRTARPILPQGLSLALIGLIIASIFIPLNALPAGSIITLAVAIFLAFGHVSDGLLLRPLTWRPIRWIGVISFSLYLWHWPVVVFIKYYFVDTPPVWMIITGIVLTFALSVLSYRYIEEPFRRHVSGRRVITALTSAVVLLVATSAVTVSSQGFPNRTPPLALTIAAATQTHFRCDLSDFIPYGGSRACYINPESNTPYDLAVIGNSHAQMYVPAIEDVLKARNESGLLIPLNACLPTTTLNISQRCLNLAQQNFDAYMNDPNIKRVIIVTTWFHKGFSGLGTGNDIPDPDHMELAKALLSLVEEIQASGREVYLVGPIRVPKEELSSTVGRKLIFGHVDEAEALDLLKAQRIDFDAEFLPAIRYLQARLTHPLIQPHRLLCDDDYCYFGTRDLMYFADGNHLGRAKAQEMAPQFARALSGS